MRIRNLMLMASLLFIVTACSTDVEDIQNIYIEHYADNQANAKLAEDLMYYDARYIAANIPGFDEQSAAGISLGFFVRESDGVPSYRIQYDLTNPGIVTNLTSLKQGFERYIPQLAADHAAKSTVFEKLIPIAQSWVDTLFNGNITLLMNSRSELIKAQMSAEKLAELAGKLSADYGREPASSFLRAQYYRAFGHSPELVSLHYLVEAKDGKSILISISTHEVGGQWQLLGLWFEPINS